MKSSLVHRDARKPEGSLGPIRASGILGVACALLFTALLTTSCGRGSLASGPGLDKTDLRERPTPDFSLVDQNGRAVGMGDLRGRAVALTFLYTSCPDVCPVITSTFGEVYDMLGNERDRVALVVVSVDPERDSVERIRQYLEAQGLARKLLFLTGERAALQPVWAAYYVGVVKGPASGTAPGGFYTVAHPNLVYVIDASGRQRTLIKGYEFTAKQLMGELRSVLR